MDPPGLIGTTKITERRGLRIQGCEKLQERRIN